MGTITDKAAIIGMGCTKFGELWDKSVDDLIIDATYEACEDAGIELKDLDAAWLGTVFSGHTAMSLSSPLAWQYKPITRVAVYNRHLHHTPGASRCSTKGRSRSHTS